MLNRIFEPSMRSEETTWGIVLNFKIDIPLTITYTLSTTFVDFLPLAQDMAYRRGITREVSEILRVLVELFPLSACTVRKSELASLR